MSLLLAAATFLLIGLAGVGCKSDAEKTVETTLESTLELHDQVYRILETNVDDPDTVFGRVWVDPDTCIGCQKCTSKGPDGLFLDGCPWDAIDMVATDEWEAEYGEVD